MGIFFFNTVGHADANNPLVLLVYDSYNTDNNKADNVYSLNRLLVSTGCNVKMMPINEYHSGTLDKGAYDGVITLINWPEHEQDNQNLAKDRLKFKGIQIHIGGNINSNEISAINGVFLDYYQRDWLLIDQARKLDQHLPHLDKLTVFDQLPSDTHTIGSLKIQGQDRLFPYGVMRNNQAYVPYYNSNDDSIFLLASLIKTMFHLPDTSIKPLLTITGVTPYTDLNVLNELSNYFKSFNQTFAISVTIPNDNFDLYAYQKFSNALNLVTQKGGLIFIKNPYVGANGPADNTIEMLHNQTRISVNHLIDRNVYPIGVGLDEYWLRDQTYRHGFSNISNTQILFNNPSQFGFAQQDNFSKTVKNSFYAVDMNQINSDQRGITLNNKNFNSNIPLAITFDMPNNLKALNKLKKNVEAIKFSLFNHDTLDTKLSTNDHEIMFSNNQYLLDGQLADRHNVDIKIKKAPKYQPIKNWGNIFFEAQNNMMLIFFIITFIILGIYLVRGRKAYMKMFKRSKHSERGD